MDHIFEMFRPFNTGFFRAFGTSVIMYEANRFWMTSQFIDSCLAPRLWYVICPYIGGTHLVNIVSVSLARHNDAIIVKTFKNGLFFRLYNYISIIKFLVWIMFTKFYHESKLLNCTRVSKYAYKRFNCLYNEVVSIW